MKAERRHELQTNSLSQFISDLPYFLRFHANKLLVGVMVICAIVILYRYRSKSVEQTHLTTIASMSGVVNGVRQLQVMDRMQSNEMARAQDRRKYFAQINAGVDQVLDNTKDPQDSALRAGALVSRGDLNWVMANLSTLPGATTQPALALQQTPTEYLQNAEGAYQQVLKNYSSEGIAKSHALLGLAAIEENRGNWDKATDYYNQLTTDPATVVAFKEVARQRLVMMPQLRTPVYLGNYSSTQPSTQPSTEPTTQPAH